MAPSSPPIGGDGIEKNNAPKLSGRLVYLVSMNLFVFIRQPPTSRHQTSDSIIIVGVGVKDKHWAQGYHRDIGASSEIQDKPSPILFSTSGSGSLAL